MGRHLDKENTCKLLDALSNDFKSTRQLSDEADIPITASIRVLRTMKYSGIVDFKQSTPHTPNDGSVLKEWKLNDKVEIIQ